MDIKKLSKTLNKMEGQAEKVPNRNFVKEVLPLAAKKVCECE